MAGTRALAVVGLDEVGRSWVRTFARAGLETSIWDPDPARIDEAWAWLKADLKQARKRQGLRKAVARSQRELVTRCETLDELMAGAIYVQESGEDRRASRKLFAELDERAGPRTVLATSSPRTDLARLVADLPGRARCIIAHPVHLPHLIPAVEVCPGPDTEAAVVRRTMRLLTRVGQAPIHVRRFIPGLLADRLRAALIREAVAAVEAGVADLPAVEDAVRQGIGLLYVLAGPLGAEHLGDDAGLRTHLEQNHEWYETLWRDPPKAAEFDPDMIDRLCKAMDGMTRGVQLGEQLAWRDEMVERLRRLKLAHPPGGFPED